MPPSPASSFIPKRNPTRRPQSVRRYNLVIMPVISYTLFMSALIAAAALYIFQIRVESQFAAAATNLDEQIQHFKDDDLSRVAEFNQRLELANTIIASHVSLVSLLAILESVTADTVQFKDLKIERKDESTLAVSAALVTSSLDGALFQRATYDESTLIAATNVAEVTLVPGSTAADGKSSVKSSVNLKADFVFSADKVLYKPLTTAASAVSETINPASSTPKSTSL